MEYHYVVVYNKETKSFYVDVDTTIARFDNAMVYDNDHWEEPDGDDYYNYEDKLAEILSNN